MKILSFLFVAALALFIISLLRQLFRKDPAATTTEETHQFKYRSKMLPPRPLPTGIMSPREWGQYLQATGRQKWTKSHRT